MQKKTMEQKVLVELTEKEYQALIRTLEFAKVACETLGAFEAYHSTAKLLEKLKRVEEK